MPKEFVTPSTPQVLNEGEDLKWTRFMPAVGWQRDCDVQLGLQAERVDITFLDQLYGHDANQKMIGDLLHKWLFGPGENGQVPRGLVPQDFRTSDEQDQTFQDLGKMVLKMVEDCRDYRPERDGIWSNLDRRQINDLIRLLRKARDNAYGRDE